MYSKEVSKMMDIFEQAAKEHAREQVIVKNQVRRKRGRPSNKEILERKLGKGRTPLTGDRSQLEVRGKSPGWHYRWIRDTHEAGSEVLRYLNAGYEFVTDKEDVIIGENAVFKSSSIGTGIRVPAGRDGDWLYLVKIPQDWYDEDQKAKQRIVDKTEETITNPEIEGKYGSIKIS